MLAKYIVYSADIFHIFDTIVYLAKGFVSMYEYIVYEISLNEIFSLYIFGASTIALYPYIISILNNSH